MKIHEKYIRRCIEISKKALGTAAPNPMVGAVITYKDSIIGEGYTSAYGGAHAEVNAIKSVKDKSLLPNSSIYVSLEPCSHFGKTPPCVDLIIKHQIKKVFIGIMDPNNKVSGRGIKKLKEAGCEVTFGILEKECRFHLRRFLSHHEKKRPYIILKWAQTKDSFLAPSKEMREGDPSPYWISNTLSRQRVHKWRTEEQAILAGTNTVLQDNPGLNVRDWYGNSPSRIIIDKELKIPCSCKIFDTSIASTIILTENSNKQSYFPEVDYELIDFKNNVPYEICKVLFKKAINSVLVEGGSFTLNSFLNANLWDEARVFTGPGIFQNGIKAPYIPIKKLMEKERIGKDYLETYFND